MAHKSKTQRARAAAKKANKEDRQIREEVNGITTSVDVAEEVEEMKDDFRSKRAKAKAEKKEREAKAAAVTATAAKGQDKTKAKPKKQRFKFFKDVKAELKRVTWPSRTDVLRWSGVVVGALLFFGIFVAILDNVIVTPALVALSGLGA